MGKQEKIINKENLNDASYQTDNSGNVCPKCGCTDYEEWEELEYKKWY